MPRDRRVTDCEGLLREARRRGAEIEKTANGHYKVLGPAGIAVVSPGWGDPRVRQNSIADVRRHAGIDVTDTPDTEQQETTVTRNGHPTHYVTGVSAGDIKTIPGTDQPSLATRADHDELLAMIVEASKQIEKLAHRVDETVAEQDRRLDTLAKAEARNRDNLDYLNKALNTKITTLENSVDALATELTDSATTEPAWITEMRAQVVATLEPFRGGAYLPRMTIAELMGLDQRETELKRLSYVLMMLRGEGALESTGSKSATRWRLTLTTKGS